MRYFLAREALCVSLIILSACGDSSDSRSQPPPNDPLLERYELSSKDSVPEGVSFDSVERAFYVTSINGASITRVDADGHESLFREPDNRAQLVGTKVDALARRLWVCAQQVDGTDNRVWVFDLETSELTMEFFLGALATGGSCNDLVLDHAGRAIVTDPANPSLYLLDPNSEEGEILAMDSLLADEAGVSLGQNGIEITPDESALIVAKFATRRLVRVSLPDGDEVTEIELNGDALPAPDGLVFLNDDLYSVSNAELARVRLNKDFTQGDVVVRPMISGLSTATVAEGEVYVIKSEVTNYVINQPLNLPFEIFRLDTTVFDK